MEDILKALNVENLNEDQQKEIKEKLENIVDIKSRERADTLLDTEKGELVEGYEAKFEEYKSDITSKFSNFVDTVLEEELVIPDKVKEFARKGELYSDIIEQFKTRISVDEGILNDEVKTLLGEARDEIIDLRDKADETTAENLELREDAKKFAANIYLREKCDGFTPDQTKKVLAMLGDVYNKDDIDTKFDIISDSIINLKEQDNEEKDENKCKCPECGKTITTDKGCKDVKCPDCDVALVPDKGEKDEEGKNGKGKSEVKDEAVDEDDKSPFQKMQGRWLNILKENRF